MAYQTVTKTSYGTRLKNSFGGIFTGFLLFIAGTALLFWNEGRTVKTTRMLKEAQGQCVELGDIAAVNADMNGKVVHASGLATTEERLADDTFGIGAVAIQIAREVEYYQWVETSHSETKDKIGGGQETTTTYEYQREWVDEPVNSSAFADPEYKDVNVVLRTYEDKNLLASHVSFGAYRLPEGLTRQMRRWTNLPAEVPQEILDPLNASLQSQEKVQVPMVQTSGNVLYLGQNPANPAVGDVRISFRQVLPGEVSLIAKVVNDSFEPFTAKNGYSLLTLQDGTVSMDNMFQTEKEGNKTTGWILRIIAFLLILIGLRSIFDIVVTLLKVLPFLANIANLGIKLVTFVLALAWTLVVFAIAWLFYRPVLGIALLVAAGALIWLLAKKSKDTPAPTVPEGPAA